MPRRGIQKQSQTNPAKPAARKGDCHPNERAIHGTMAGAIIAPTFAPELKMPVAKARSFWGNHSATVLIAAGKLPPSPNPSSTRAEKKPPKLETSECAIAARLQAAMETEYPSFVPKRSTNHPKNSRLTA